MRAPTLSFLIALTVFFTAFGGSYAHAQGAGHCINRALVSVESRLESRVLPRKTRNFAKEPVIVASTIAQVRQVNAELPGRSQMPTMCVDETQPGCQVERSDSPHHRSLLRGDVDAGDVTDFFAGLNPLPEDAPRAGSRYEGVPCEGHLRGLWRPPTA